MDLKRSAVQAEALSAQKEIEHLEREINTKAAGAADAVMLWRTSIQIHHQLRNVFAVEIAIELLAFFQAFRPVLLLEVELQPFHFGFHDYELRS